MRVSKVVKQWILLKEKEWKISLIGCAWWCYNLCAKAADGHGLLGPSEDGILLVRMEEYLFLLRTYPVKRISRTFLTLPPPVLLLGRRIVVMRFTSLNKRWWSISCMGNLPKTTRIWHSPAWWRTKTSTRIRGLRTTIRCYTIWTYLKRWESRYLLVV